MMMITEKMEGFNEEMTIGHRISAKSRYSHFYEVNVQIIFGLRFLTKVFLKFSVLL